MDNQTFLHDFLLHLRGLFPEIFAEANEYESIGIALCIAPILQPDLLENCFRQEVASDGEYPALGGIKGTNHRGILPTGETWIYFCCKLQLDNRIDFIRSIPQYLTQPNALLNIEPAPPGDPFMAGMLVFSSYFRKRYQSTGIIYEQRLSNLNLGGFIESKLELNDLVLTEEVLRSLDEIRHWRHFQELSEDIPFTKRMKKGLKVIFHGKPGTGKTETAAILGRELERKVYRIDLAQIVSKYIGETEKNLSKIFEAAEKRNWILFFDEGDALFGKRTSVNSANDRYANQEVAYLLQRIEDYTGIIIVSTNFKENVDAAFIRRFHIIAEFNLPDRQQRKLIWEKLLHELVNYAPELNAEEWEELLKTELSGGAITNVVNYSMLKASYKETQVQFSMLKEGIVREMRKENRLTSL
jgi:AAA+ superfamily predicted ATPase